MEESTLPRVWPGVARGVAWCGLGYGLAWPGVVIVCGLFLSSLHMFILQSIQFLNMTQSVARCGPGCSPVWSGVWSSMAQGVAQCKEERNKHTIPCKEGAKEQNSIQF